MIEYEWLYVAFIFGMICGAICAWIGNKNK